MAAFRSAKTVLQESVNNGDNVAKAQGGRTKKSTVRTHKSPGPKAEPPPTAVARRNARERNRVKQVNNGFAALRQRIPNEIAEMYENANNNNRTANKKLSKVETLRMAVEYIRSLESLLSFNETESKENENASMASFPSPASSESLHNGSSYLSVLEDEDSNPPPLPPVSTHRYSRIPGTNAFRLIPGTAISFEDEENVHPPLTPNSDEILATTHMSDVEFSQAQDFGLHFYEENSPASSETVAIVDYQQNVYYQPVVYQRQIPILIQHQDVREPAEGEHVEIILRNEIVDENIKPEPDEGLPHEIETQDMIEWWRNQSSQQDQT